MVTIYSSLLYSITEYTEALQVPSWDAPITGEKCAHDSCCITLKDIPVELPEPTRDHRLPVRLHYHCVSRIWTPAHERGVS